MVVNSVDLGKARADAHDIEQLRQRRLIALGDELYALAVVAVAHPAGEAACDGLAAYELPEAHALDPAGDDGLQPLHSLPPGARRGPRSGRYGRQRRVYV